MDPWIEELRSGFPDGHEAARLTLRLLTALGMLES